MNKKKYIINILIILIVGGVSIYFSIGSQLKGTIESLKRAQIIWLIVAILIMLLYYLVVSLNLKVFANVYKKDYSLKQAIVNAMSGIFFSGITPMSTGGQFYQVYAFNKQGIKPTYSSSILLMLFIVYQSVLVLFTSIIMVFRYSFYSSIYSGFFSLAILGFIINFCVIASLFIGAKSKTLQNFFCKYIIKFLAAIHIVKNYDDKVIEIQQKLDSFRSELTILLKNKEVLLKSILLNFARLIILYSMPFFVAMALDVPLTVGQFFDFIGITAFIYMISDFVPLPGASGGSEGTFYLLFKNFLKSATSATLLIWRVFTYYMGLVIGGFIMAFSKELHQTNAVVIEEDGKEIEIEEIDDVSIDDVKGD
ncbi:MAG: lysylphosphatidylglycerol synthase transmembrane domain-containing protein [Thomasclavelia sp.]|nr:lysylphosphatidylglycerol synthase transmembrane domain-containing protein [Thomasclavelia sp.]